MDKTKAIAAAVLGVCAVLAAADYFALFGTTSTDQLELLEMNFVTVDEVTGAPVTGVHVRCFQSNNKNACAEKTGGVSGRVSISIPVTKVVTRSYLFIQDSKVRETADPSLKVMFIHPDYANPVESFMVSKLAEQTAAPLTVSMPRSRAQKY